MVPQPLAGSLEAAMAGMTFTILPGRWALIGIDGPPHPADVAVLEHGPSALVREPGASTDSNLPKMISSALIRATIDQRPVHEPPFPPFHSRVAA